MNFNNENIIIVAIINVIVKLNYIFSIIIKNTDHRKNDNIHFLKQLIQTLNMALEIKNAYFHIFTKHLSVVFKMEFSKRTF